MASTRLPGKPLLPLADIPMVIRVANNLLPVLPKENIVICSADQLILDVAMAHGYPSFLTHDGHASGTDRIGQVAPHYPADAYLNVQGDMPVLNEHDIRALLAHAQQHTWDMVTMAKPLTDLAAYHDPNTVKVICDQQGKALYFSRSPIPFTQQAAQVPPSAMAHVGVYWFTAKALQRFVQAPRQALEQSENLEQLRALALGMTIGVCQSQYTCFSVDTAQDANKVQAWLHKQNQPPTIQPT